MTLKERKLRREIRRLRDIIRRTDKYFHSPEIAGSCLIVPHTLAMDIRSVAERYPYKKDPA